MDDEQVVITGGEDTGDQATLYNRQGFVKDLPRLNTGREYHGCAMFINQDNEKVLFLLRAFSTGHFQVLIVAGGWDGSSQLNSTELMTYSPGSEMKWRPAGPLPRVMYGVRMVNLNGECISW